MKDWFSSCVPPIGDSPGSTEGGGVTAVAGPPYRRARTSRGSAVIGPFLINWGDESGSSSLVPGPSEETWTGT